MKNRLEDYYNKHAGETCLIIGVGPNLHLTPPAWFDFPSFGVNTLYKYAGYKPTYFVGVDERLKIEDGAMICETYPDVPKFFPAPDWDDLQGENILRFVHKPGLEFSNGGRSPRHKDALTREGITYRRIMDAVFQIAWHMGFTKMLMIGVQHKPYDAADADRAHFWGVDTKAVSNQPFDWWFDGYKYFVNAMSGVQVLNISEDTYVPENILPRDDWRKYAIPNVQKPEKVMEALGYDNH